MDNQLLGGIVGLVLAIGSYSLIGRVIDIMEARDGNDRNPQTARTAMVLDWVRKLDLVIFPAVMFYAFGFIEGRIIG